MNGLAAVDGVDVGRDRTRVRSGAAPRRGAGPRSRVHESAASDRLGAHEVLMG